MNERGSAMKFISNLRARMRKNIIKGQSGQGATEYILLLVVIVGLVIMFGPRIKKAISEKTDSLNADIQSVNKDM